MGDSLYRIIGLAKRANKIVSGSGLFDAIRSKEVYLVLICSDASDRTQKQLSDKSSYYQIEVWMIGQSDQLSLAIGQSNRVAVGISDRGFARKCVEMLKNEGGTKYEK